MTELRAPAELNEAVALYGLRCPGKIRLFRPVGSATRASDLGADSAMIPSNARMRCDSTLAKLSADGNQTFASPAAQLKVLKTHEDR